MKFDLGLLVFGSYYSVLKLGFLNVDDETGYRLHLSKCIFYFFVLLLRLRAIPYQRDGENFVIG